MYLSLDIETQGLEINTPIHYIGIYSVNKSGKELFISFKMPDDLTNFKTFIESRLNKGDKFVGHNFKFDTARILYSYGIDIPIHNDTIFLGYLMSTVTELKENKYSKWLSLKSMAQRYLNVPNWDIDKKKKTSTNDEEVIPYLKLDCKYTYELFILLKNKLPKRKFDSYKLMLKVSNCYKYIEVNGVPIDYNNLEKVTEKYKEEKVKIYARLSELSGRTDINYNSPKQLQELLFTDLGLPVISYTDTGQPSTGVETLKELHGKHEIVDILLNMRMVEKSLAFLNDWKERAILHKDDNIYYLHPTFNLHSTVTGRTSSNNPNFQQIPRNKDLKSLFTYPGSEYRMVCADFSQAELRFASIIADVKNMKESYTNGEDLHTKIASIVNNIEPSEITKKQRTAAKAVNFGFLYGMSAESFVSYAKLSYGVIITQEEARIFRDHYFELYPELNLYYSQVDDDLYMYGELKSIMKRHYTIDLSEYFDKYKRSSILRAAINFPVQSSASDYVLCALYAVMTDERLKGKIKVGGTVHDSIILLLKTEEDEADFIKNCNIIKDLMEHPPLAKDYLTKEIDIPIVVDVEIGPLGKGLTLEEFAESTLPF